MSLAEGMAWHPQPGGYPRGVAAAQGAQAGVAFFPRGQDGVVPPLPDPGDLPDYEVSGAGDANFNGTYRWDGVEYAANRVWFKIGSYSYYFYHTIGSPWVMYGVTAGVYEHVDTGDYVAPASGWTCSAAPTGDPPPTVAEV